MTITEQNVEVYDDSRHNKPEVGKKLNKPAIITFYRINLKPGETQISKE